MYRFRFIAWDWNYCERARNARETVIGKFMKLSNLEYRIYTFKILRDRDFSCRMRVLFIQMNVTRATTWPRMTECRICCVFHHCESLNRRIDSLQRWLEPKWGWNFPPINHSTDAAVHFRKVRWNYCKYFFADTKNAVKFVDFLLIRKSYTWDDDACEKMKFKPSSFSSSSVREWKRWTWRLFIHEADLQPNTQNTSKWMRQRGINVHRFEFPITLEEKKWNNADLRFARIDAIF